MPQPGEGRVAYEPLMGEHEAEPRYGFNRARRARYPVGREQLSIQSDMR